MSSYTDEDEEDELYNVHMKEYEVPWWVKMVASLPRIDFTFESVKASLDFSDSKYKESVLFWVAVPVLWLLFSLFLFLIYFCYRCCQQDGRKRGRVTCLKWTLSVITIVTCGVVGVGICGNEDANKGVNHVISSFSDILATSNNIRNNVAQLMRSVNSTVMKDINHLKTFFTPNYRQHQASSQAHPMTLLEHAFVTLETFRTDLQDDVASKVASFNYHHQVNFVKNCEFYRRLGSLGLLGWHILLLLLLLAGIGNNSRCILLLFCAFGIFSLVLTGIFSGVHLGLSIVLGDFCSDPDTIVSNYVKRYVDIDIIDYYIRCDLHIGTSPFSEVLKKTTESLINANHTIMEVFFKSHEHAVDLMHEAQMNIEKDLSAIRSTFYNLVSLVECTNVHKDYLDILDGVCYQTMPGVLLMFSSSMTTGLLFCLLILISSKVWKLFAVYKSYTEGDEDEGGPFIAHQQNPSPSYYGYPKVRAQSSHIASYNRRTTPPPAYNSNEFYRQYNNDINNDRNDFSLRDPNA